MENTCRVFLVDFDDHVYPDISLLFSPIHQIPSTLLWPFHHSHTASTYYEVVYSTRCGLCKNIEPVSSAGIENHGQASFLSYFDYIKRLHYPPQTHTHT